MAPPPPKELQCQLCKGLLTNPKCLPCLHSFCEECLQDYVQHESTCPTCKTPLEVDYDKVSTLATNVFILKQLEQYSSSSTTSSSSGLPPPQKKEKILCQDEMNEASCYCYECEIYLCEGCLKVHRKGKVTTGHKIIPIQEVQNGGFIPSSSKSSSSSYCLKHIQKEIELYCESCEDLICSFCVSDHKSHIICSIDDSFKDEKVVLVELLDQINSRKSNLEQEIKGMEKQILSTEMLMSAIENQISDFFKEFHEALTQRESELLSELKHSKKRRNDELQLQKDYTEIGIENINDASSIISTSLSQESDQIGLLAMKKLFTSRLYYLLNHNWKSDLNDLLDFNFFVWEEQKNQLLQSISKLGSITSKGLYRDYFVNEGCQFVLGKENWDNRLSTPTCTAVDSKGNVYVSDFDHSRVLVFDEKGKYLYQLDQFKKPLGIAIDLHDNIYICDFGNHCILQFDERRTLLSSFGSKGNGDGQLTNPSGLALDVNNNIYVCDEFNHRIQIFDSNGSFISKFGSHGTGVGQFDYPFAIAINSKNQIIVSDFQNHRIQIFDSKGSFISKFGSFGSLDGQFNYPWFISVDPNDYLIITDQANHRLQIFDPLGNFVTKLEHEEMDRPAGIALDHRNKKFLVSDAEKNKIFIF